MLTQLFNDSANGLYYLWKPEVMLGQGNLVPRPVAFISKELKWHME